MVCGVIHWGSGPLLDSWVLFSSFKYVYLIQRKADIAIRLWKDDGQSWYSLVYMFESSNSYQVQGLFVFVVLLLLSH